MTMAKTVPFKGLDVRIHSDIVHEDYVHEQFMRNQYFRRVPFLVREGYDRRIVIDVLPDGGDFVAEVDLLEKRRLRGYDWERVPNSLCGFYVARPGESRSMEAECERFVRYMKRKIIDSMDDVSLPLMYVDVRPVELRGDSLLVELSPDYAGDLSPADFWSNLSLGSICDRSTAGWFKDVWDSVFMAFSKYPARVKTKDASLMQKRLQFGCSDLSTMVRLAYVRRKHRPDYSRFEDRLVEDMLSKIYLTEKGLQFRMDFIREYRDLKHLDDYKDVAKQFIWLQGMKIKEE